MWRPVISPGRLFLFISPFPLPFRRGAQRAGSSALMMTSDVSERLFSSESYAEGPLAPALEHKKASWLACLVSEERREDLELWVTPSSTVHLLHPLASFFDPGSHVALRVTAPHLVSPCQVLGVLRTEPRAGLQLVSPLPLSDSVLSSSLTSF